MDYAGRNEGGEIRTETLTFNVAANTETQSRSANIELVAGETVIETILIYQEAYYDPAQMVLKVEAKEYSSSAYNNKVYLPLYGAVDVTVNWGDGQSEPVAATISTAAAMVNHTYAESGIYYVTISGTTEKLSGRLTNKTVAPAILEVRQWGKLGMTTLDYAFANTSLVTVPQPEEDAFAAVTTVEYMFSGCAALETVPEGLLAGAPEITSVASMFYNCTALKSVPEKLFEKTTKATSASGLFSGCKALESVPAGLLADMPALTNLGSIFNNCASLKSVPRNILHQPDGSEQPHVGILRLRGARNPARRAVQEHDQAHQRRVAVQGVCKPQITPRRAVRHPHGSDEHEQSVQRLQDAGDHSRRYFQEHDQNHHGQLSL